jgi:hypothetical protein
VKLPVSQRLKAFERNIRRASGPRREEGENCIMMSSIIFTLQKMILG